MQAKDLRKLTSLTLLIHWRKNKLNLTGQKLMKQRKRAKSKQSGMIRPTWRRKYRLKKMRLL